MNCAMSSLTKTLSVFPTERIIVGRERAKGSYQAAPYFLAKLAAESPVSALFPALFGAIVYPACGLHQRASRRVSFCSLGSTALVVWLRDELHVFPLILKITRRPVPRPSWLQSRPSWPGHPTTQTLCAQFGSACSLMIRMACQIPCPVRLQVCVAA